MELSGRLTGMGRRREEESMGGTGRGRGRGRGRGVEEDEKEGVESETSWDEEKGSKGGAPRRLSHGGNTKSKMAWVLELGLQVCFCIETHFCFHFPTQTWKRGLWNFQTNS